MYTNGAPAVKEMLTKSSIVLIMLLLVSYNLSKAQNFNVAPFNLQKIQEYELATSQYYGMKLDAEIQQLLAVKKKWWYYLPSIGFSFGMPAISFGTATIAQIDYSNRQQEAKKLYVYDLHSISYRDAIAHIRAEYKSIENQIEYYWSLVKVSELTKKRLMIYSDAESKRQIEPLLLMDKEIEYERELLTISAQAKEIKERIIRIEEFSKYRYPINNFRNSAGECIVELRTE